MSLFPLAHGIVSQSQGANIQTLPIHTQGYSSIYSANSVLAGPNQYEDLTPLIPVDTVAGDLLLVWVVAAVPSGASNDQILANHPSMTTYGFMSAPNTMVTLAGNYQYTNITEYLQLFTVNAVGGGNDQLGVYMSSLSTPDEWDAHCLRIRGTGGTPVVQAGATVVKDTLSGTVITIPSPGPTTGPNSIAVAIGQTKRAEGTGLPQPGYTDMGSLGSNSEMSTHVGAKLVPSIQDIGTTTVTASYSGAMMGAVVLLG